MPRTAAGPSWRADRSLGVGQQTRGRRAPRRPAPRGRAPGSGPARRPPPPRAADQRAARASRASASSPAPNRGASRCWSNVEEGDQAGAVHPVEGRLGPDHQTGPVHVVAESGVSAVSSTAGVASRAASSSVARDTPMRSDLSLVESQTAHTAGRSSPHRPQASPPPALGLGHGAAAAGAAGQFAAVPARQHPDAPRPVEHAHHPAVGPVQLGVGRGRQSLGEQSGPRVVAGAVDHLDHRPAPALEGPLGGDQPAALGEHQRWAGRDQHHRGAVAPAPLEHHVDGRPRGRRAPPGGPRRGRPAPRRPTGASIGAQAAARVPTVTHPPRRAAAQSSGSRATGTPDGAQPDGQVLGPDARGGHHQHAVGHRCGGRPPGSAGSSRGPGPGGPRPTPPPARASSTRATDPPPGESTGTGRGGGAGPRARTTRGRRGRAEEGRDGTGPPPRRPFGQGDHRRRGPEPARDGQVDRVARRGRA